MNPYRGRTYRRYQLRVELEPATRRFRCHCAALFLFVLAAALTYVWLRSEEDRLGRESQELRHDLDERNKELVNLRVEMEGYRSGRHILTAVDRMGLKLRPPTPGQVRRIPSSSTEAAPKWLAVEGAVARK